MSPENLITIQNTAARHGKLTMWTIYDRPKDYPHGFIARLHEVPGGPTPCELYGELEDLRERFRQAGFTPLVRGEGDEPPIVETWI
jgi:hypothetical protein